MSQIGLSMLAEGAMAQEQINYVTRSPNGRVLRSSTIPLRDSDGQVFGAFCINVDVTELRLLSKIILELSGSIHEVPEPITFVDDISDVIRAIIDEEEIRIGTPINRLNKQDRINIFRGLDSRGIFSIQRSIPQVAEYLGISRATAYSYLDEIRSSDNSDESS